MDPIFQLACRDRNRIALESDLLSAAMFGIENILCLTGDHTKMGDHLPGWSAGGGVLFFDLCRSDQYG